MENPAAWHPDPTGRHEHRWWDGERWTEHVADAGQSSIDPIDGGTGPSASEDTSAAADAAGDVGGVTEQPSATTDQGTTSWQQPEGAQPGADQGGWAQPGGAQPSGGPANGGGWQQPGAGQGGAPAGGQPGWGQQPPGQQGWQQQQQWPQATPAPQPQATGSSGLAIFALILGILSLLFFWVPILGGIGALITVILGIVGRSSAKKRGIGGAGMGIAGVILGIIALVLNILVTLVVFGALGNMNVFGFARDYVECMEQYDDEEFCEQQLEDSIWDWFSD